MNFTCGGSKVLKQEFKLKRVTIKKDARSKFLPIHIGVVVCDGQTRCYILDTFNEYFPHFKLSNLDLSSDIEGWSCDLAKEQFKFFTNNKLNYLILDEESFSYVFENEIVFLDFQRDFNKAILLLNKSLRLEPSVFTTVIYDDSLNNNVLLNFININKKKHKKEEVL